MTTAVEWETKWRQKVGISKARMITAGINWDMDALMVDQGIPNAAGLHELLKTSDVECTPEEVEALYQGWMPARTRDGEWHPVSLGICEILGCTPDAVFDHEHQWHPDDVVGNLSATADYEEIARRSESSQGILQDDAILDKEISTQIMLALGRLSPREERVIRFRFGFGCEELIYEDIAAKFSVTRERIRQIEVKALRKLKHPANSGKLKYIFREKFRKMASLGMGSPSIPRAQSPEINVPMFQRKHVANRIVEESRYSRKGWGTGFVSWPILDKYGLSMKTYLLANGKAIVAIGTDHSADNYNTDQAGKDIDARLLYHREILSRLGFKPCRNGMFANLSGMFSIGEFKHYLPLTTEKIVRAKDVVVRRTPVSAPGMHM